MKALSPLISMVLVVAFGFTAMTIVLTMVNPMLDRAKDSGIVNEATQNMQLLDAAIKTVASEPKASKRIISIKLTDGVLRTDEDKEWVYLDFDPKTDYTIDGVLGDVEIVSRPQFLEYFNHYNDGTITGSDWATFNGTWTVDSGRFKGAGGIAYHNLGNISNGFEFTGSVTSNTDPEGQIFVIPGDPQDLVLYLPFDGNVNDTITTAYDYSAYKNNGTLKNGTDTCASGDCPQWVDGKFGNATKFDGVNDYVDVGNDTSLNFGDGTNDSPFSVVAWVNMKDATEFNVVSKGVYGGENWEYTVFTTNADRWGIQLADESVNAWPYRRTGTAMTSYEGSWVHFAATYDGRGGATAMNGVTLYVNSVVTSGDTIENYANYVAMESLPHNVWIGAREGTYSNGLIDEVRIYNRVLSADEIAFSYEADIKKITTAGEIPTISEDANVTIVLASPGSTYFDNVKLKSGPVKIKFVIPYQRIDIQNQARFGPGDHNIVIKNYGTNTTTNRPLIGLEE